MSRVYCWRGDQKISRKWRIKNVQLDDIAWSAEERGINDVVVNGVNRVVVHIGRLLIGSVKSVWCGVKDKNSGFSWVVSHEDIHQNSIHFELHLSAFNRVICPCVLEHLFADPKIFTSGNIQLQHRTVSSCPSYTSDRINIAWRQSNFWARRLGIHGCSFEQNSPDPWGNSSRHVKNSDLLVFNSCLISTDNVDNSRRIDELSI